MSNNTDWLDEVLENVFMVGVEHEKRTIPEIDKLQAKSKAAINKKLNEARLDELNIISDKLDDLHQRTEGAGFVHYGELGEWLDDHIAALQATKEKLG